MLKYPTSGFLAFGLTGLKRVPALNHIFHRWKSICLFLQKKLNNRCGLMILVAWRSDQVWSDLRLFSIHILIVALKSLFNTFFVTYRWLRTIRIIALLRYGTAYISVKKRLYFLLKHLMRKEMLLIPSKGPDPSFLHSFFFKGAIFDTFVQQTVNFRYRVNKLFVFGGASTNGSFSEARQQTARFRWRLNKQVKSFFDIFKLISDS